MKKLISIAVCLFVVLNLPTVKAQNKSFTGTINYAITYPGAEKDPVSQGAPGKMVTKVSSDKIKTEIATQMMTQSEIVDYVANTKLQLLDIMGTYRYAIKTSAAQVDSMNKAEEPLKITETKETKVIAGYTCTKYTAEDEEGNVFIGYFTKEITGSFDNWNTPFRGIKGTALEFEMPAQGGKMNFAANEIKKEVVKAEEFAIPTGFKVVTEAELKAEMEKLQGGGR